MRVLTRISACTYSNKCVYLRKYLPRTYFGEYVVLISCCCYRRAPTGRYSCKAQGASPGLIIETHLLSPVGAALSCANIGCGRYVVLYLSVGVLACEGKCRSCGALNFVVFCFPRVSYRALPSFHPGLCRSVVPTALIMRPLHNTALATLLSTFRPRHLQE